MQYIYMNHRIKQKRPRKPVIVCQRTNPAQTIESNCMVLTYGGRTIGKIVFDRGGLEACESHEVKAWVELCDEVAVIADTAVVTEHWHIDPKGIKLMRAEPTIGRAVASQKLPNTPVNIVEIQPEAEAVSTICVDAAGYCTDKCGQKVVNGSCACLNRGPYSFPTVKAE